MSQFFRSVRFCLLVVSAMLAMARQSVGIPPESSDAEKSLNRLTQEELDDGWIMLFDGETLFGWEPDGNADWKVQDGAIVVATGDVCLLHSYVQFADFELKCDFKAPPSTNSGLFLRTVHNPKDVQKDCYELNIAGPGVSPFTTGSFVGRKADYTAPESFDGDWHTFHVTARAGEWTVLLDGKKTLTYIDEAPRRRGYIALQHNSGEAAFRNIKLKPLGLSSLLSEKGLEGWNEFPGRRAKFGRGEHGGLTIQGGPGQLESVNRYADFILQAEVFVNGDNLNSGIFFRCIPGEYSNGYESQIHNGFIDGDRTKPVDFGTGAIYRRVKARKVVSDDRVWFHKTIAADGPRIAVWVEGYPVTAWTDVRNAHANPREGLRTEAGTIVLQAHDPGTDLFFRDLSLVDTGPTSENSAPSSLSKQ